MIKKTILSLSLALSVLSGIAYANDNTNINSEQSPTSSQQKYNEITTGGGKLVKIDSSITEALKLIKNNASGFYTGTEKKGSIPVIIFFDPECPYCKMLWNEVSNIKDSPRTFWIPVGILAGDKSEKEAALLLDNKDKPEGIMEKLKEKQDLSSEKVSDENLKNVQRNTLLFGTLKLSSVPVILKVTKDQFLYFQNGFMTGDKFDTMAQY